MRLMIVRHGEPNYEFDTLTERGWLEAASAAERLAKLKIQAFYVSPPGTGAGYRQLYAEKNAPHRGHIRLAAGIPAAD